MALNVTNLLTVLGKEVKAVNTVNALFASLETAKDAIFTVLEAEGLQDLYVDIPSQFDTMKDSVESWIQTFISNVEGVLTDETYVLEQLPIFATDVTTVLNAIFDKMLNDTDTIQSSVVSLGGSDVDQSSFQINSTEFRVFLTRLLDGVNAPSSLVSPHTSYTNVEGQLSKTCTTFAKVISEDLGSETLQLFGDSPFEPSYTKDSENPGPGPTLTNALGNNSLTNPNFRDWSSHNPTNWTLTGGSAGTDWDYDDVDTGPLHIMTAGVTVKQKLTGLTRRQMYFFGALFTATSTGAHTATEKLRVETVDGGTVYKNFSNVTFTVGTSVVKYIYGFWAADDTINLDDVYICFEHDAESNANVQVQLYNTIVTPVIYFNGLGFVAWCPNDSETIDSNYFGGSQIVFNDDYGSIAISNNNAGVFQTFFRKAFNIQLPTADSPTISDSLAT